jgi:uncharacterized protein
MSALSSPSLETGKSEGDFVVSSFEDVVLTDAPINPDWIRSGNPRARTGLHSHSLDKNASTHVWDCTAGSFDWRFACDETVIILEGSVKITRGDGSIEHLQKGDVAFFAAGSVKLWVIEDYVKKLAFCRLVLPTPIATLFRIRHMMRTVWKRWR